MLLYPGHFNNTIASKTTANSTVVANEIQGIFHFIFIVQSLMAFLVE